MTEATEIETLVALKSWLATLDPETLAPVPPGNRAEQILERTRWQLICTTCGGWGYCAYVMDSLLGRPISPRWLDLCPRCDHLLRKAMDAAAVEDGFILLAQPYTEAT